MLNIGYDFVQFSRGESPRKEKRASDKNGYASERAHLPRGSTSVR